ncbi:MAG: serine hydrolase domain-containing protein [bacterium]
MEGFERGRDTGAAVGVVLDGRVLVDIWHGHADRQRQRPWQSDTLVCQFSVTKAMTTLCLLQAVDRGLLKLDETVVASWPEFAAHDKHEITLRHLLCHRAGLIGFHEPMPAELFEDWQHTTDALAAERPWWPPGSRHGYHARTFGFLAGEGLPPSNRPQHRHLVSRRNRLTQWHRFPHRRPGARSRPLCRHRAGAHSRR